MVIEMPVKIGTVDLSNVLNWEEEEVSSIPVKRVIRKTSPTTQAQYFIREPRKIVITARLTPAEKLSLRNLKNQFNWQPLCDYEATGACGVANSEFVDYVWIEKINHNYRGNIDRKYRWSSIISLICSQT